MLEDNLGKIKRRIESVCAGCNRSSGQVTIVAVSKGRTVEQIKEAATAGLTNIGENKVQEAIVKYNELRITDYGLRNVRWHMVGHLQTNKAKDAVRIFDLIHSVDSVRLAEEINKQAAKINKIQDVLVEVNTSAEAAKSGFRPDEAIEAIRRAAILLRNINIKGLMTVAPLADNPEKTRPYFKLLRVLKDRINELRITDYGLRILSMGMSDDFEVAIEEGANMIRLGRAIFEG